MWSSLGEWLVWLTDLYKGQRSWQGNGSWNRNESPQVTGSCLKIHHLNCFTNLPLMMKISRDSDYITALFVAEDIFIREDRHFFKKTPVISRKPCNICVSIWSTLYYHLSSFHICMSEPIRAEICPKSYREQEIVNAQLCSQLQDHRTTEGQLHLTIWGLLGSARSCSFLTVHLR